MIGREYYPKPNQDTYPVLSLGRPPLGILAVKERSLRAHEALSQ